MNNSLTANKLFLFAVSVLLSSCISFHSPKQRYQQALELAQQHQWHSHVLSTDYFDLITFFPKVIPSTSVLRIYIEGDGLAWKNRYTISNNPTPITPVALQLALTDKTNNKQKNVAYLARPCQFVSDNHKKNCEPSVWTNARFSEKNIAATNQAIDQLKTLFNATEIELVGYSGGGAIACLVAARRQDVKKITTIAGNLDHPYWTQLHKVSPLTDSLNPMDFREQIKRIPQLHLVGDKDKNTPPEMIKHFVEGFTKDGVKQWEASVHYKIIPSYDHQCCWSKSLPTSLFQREELNPL
jgi:dienelactone hydrolase